MTWDGDVSALFCSDLKMMGALRVVPQTHNRLSWRTSRHSCYFGFIEAICDKELTDMSRRVSQAAL
jgi:hypothetical protein